MKIPPFTLVYKPYLKNSDSVGRADLSSASLLETRVRRLLSEFDSEAKRNLLKASAKSMSLDIEEDAASAEKISAFETLAADLHKNPSVVTIGLWDLGTRAGNLSKVISRLNEGQKNFTFYDVQAAVPAGLISRRERILSWAEKHAGNKPKKISFPHQDSNVIADDFFDYAREVRHYFNIGYIFGIIPQRIASLEEGNRITFNSYAASSGRSGKGRLCLISTFNLREQAKDSGRSFESSIALLVVFQLLITLSKTLTYETPKDCIFNCVSNETKRIEALKELEIKAECLNQVSPLYRATANELMQTLRGYEEA